MRSPPTLPPPQNLKCAPVSSSLFRKITHTATHSRQLIGQQQQPMQAKSLSRARCERLIFLKRLAACTSSWFVRFSGNMGKWRPGYHHNQGTQAGAAFADELNMELSW